MWSTRVNRDIVARCRPTRGGRKEKEEEETKRSKSYEVRGAKLGIAQILSHERGKRLRKEEKKVFFHEKEEKARIRRGKGEAIVHFQPDPSSPHGRAIRTSVLSGLVREKNLPNLPSQSSSTSSSFAVTMDDEYGPMSSRGFSHSKSQQLGSR